MPPSFPTCAHGPFCEEDKTGGIQFISGDRIQDHGQKVRRATTQEATRGKDHG